LEQKIDQIYMSEALKKAKEAFELDEVCVGAIVVYQRQIIARAHNQTRLLKDPTAHAEMVALTQAANFLRNERLLNCTLYVTIEPCLMCAGAMVLARIRRVVFGASDPKTGACGSLMDILAEKRLNHHISVTGGILAKECGMLMSEFFQKQRRLGKK
jgi:tRNA(adenine34) deaminase